MLQLAYMVELRICRRNGRWPAKQSTWRWDGRGERQCEMCGVAVEWTELGRIRGLDVGLGV